MHTIAFLKFKYFLKKHIKKDSYENLFLPQNKEIAKVITQFFFPTFSSEVISQLFHIYLFILFCGRKLATIDS